MSEKPWKYCGIFFFFCHLYEGSERALVKWKSVTLSLALFGTLKIAQLETVLVNFYEIFRTNRFKQVQKAELIQIGLHQKEILNFCP